MDQNSMEMENIEVNLPLPIIYGGFFIILKMGENAPPLAPQPVLPITYGAPTSGLGRKMNRDELTNLDLKN